MRRWLAAAVGCWALAAPACPLPAPSVSDGALQLAWASQPAQRAVGQPFALLLTLCPADARLVAVDATMPEHRHGMNYRVALTPQGGGRWRADGLLWHMSGRWELRFDIETAAGEKRTLRHSVLLAAGVLDFDGDELARIAAHGPWPPPLARDASNRVEGLPAAVAWGRELFFSKRLASDGTRSCAGCHVPARAFQDAVALAAGQRRNAPSLLDAATRRWWGWDGRHDSLWAASLAPLVAEREMGQRIDTLAARIRGEPALARGYRRAFGHPPGSDDEAVAVDVAKALAAYQATLMSPRTLFDRFRDALVAGDHRAAARYPAAAQRGLRLFVGSARCSVCHAGPAFSNGEFADIGRPFFVAGGGVDPGRHGGLQALRASAMNRGGRHNDAGAADPRALLTRQVLVQPRHFGEFRVPPLRALARTAPYMHDGGLAGIDDVVAWYSRLDEDRLHADGERILKPLNLTPTEAADLAAFLRTL